MARQPSFIEPKAVADLVTRGRHFWPNVDQGEPQPPSFEHVGHGKGHVALRPVIVQVVTAGGPTSRDAPRSASVGRQAAAHAPAPPARGPSCRPRVACARGTGR